MLDSFSFLNNIRFDRTLKNIKLKKLRIYGLKIRVSCKGLTLKINHQICIVVLNTFIFLWKKKKLFVEIG